MFVLYRVQLRHCGEEIPFIMASPP